MAYFKVKKNGATEYTDLSGYVSGLKVGSYAKYNSQESAAGNTRVDYINSKKVIEVTFIPLTDDGLNTLLTNIGFVNSIQYRKLGGNTLETITSATCDTEEIEYYNLTVNRKYKEFTLTFQEL